MSDARLIYFEGIPDQEIDRACSDLRDIGLKCELCKLPPLGPWNSVEWYVPTVIVLFIAQPYLRSFIGEMGKDHYGLLKNGLAKLWHRFFGENTEVPKVTVLGGDGIRKFEYTHTFSFLAETNDGRKFKLMLPADIGEENFARHVDVFFDFLYNHYAGDDDAVIPSYFTIKMIDDIIFVTLAENRQSIRFLDPLPSDIRNKVGHTDLV